MDALDAFALNGWDAYECESCGKTVIAKGRIDLDATCTECGEVSEDWPGEGPAENDIWTRIPMEKVREKLLGKGREGGRWTGNRHTD